MMSGLGLQSLDMRLNPVVEHFGETGRLLWDKLHGAKKAALKKGLKEMSALFRKTGNQLEWGEEMQ